MRRTVRYLERLPLLGILFRPIFAVARFGFYTLLLLVNPPEAARYLFTLLHPLLFSGFARRAVARHRSRKPEQPAPTQLRVVHVTCSFDLGGTQRQIIHLCTSSSGGRFEHRAVECFPEQNFLYRTDATMDPDRYVTGGAFTRLVGRWCMDFSFRSQQLLQVYKLVRDFEALKPDIVVGWGHEVAMLTFMAAAFSGTRTVCFCIRTFGECIDATKLAGVIRAQHRRFLPHVDAAIVNSTALRQDYAMWTDWPEAEIVVCANGVETAITDANERTHARAAVRRRLGISESAVVVLNVGRFSIEKGQRRLLEAFARVSETHDDIHCIFCGDGPTQPELEERARQRDLESVHFVGRVTDVHSYLYAADVFVMPSDYEGMPNAMMEAMASGLACLSTDRSGALDIARDEHEALYVSAGDGDGMTTALARLVGSADLRARLGQAARQRIKEFTVPAMVRRFEAELEELV